MLAKINLDVTALKELEESLDWYQHRSTISAERFLSTIKNTLTTRSQNPETFAKTKEHLREVVVDVFPYIIVYRYDKVDNVAYILHIFHTSRNPKIKFKRK